MTAGTPPAGARDAKLLHVVGARPNFPKLAPVWRAAHARGARQVVVHTGQHYDEALSGGFLRDLGLAEPDINLEVGSASHAVQTARIIERIEPVLVTEQPDWVVVYGDVNSTMAAAIVASKLDLKVAHVEAGLRSGDRTMPEEINRIVTDRIATLLLTPSRDADAALRREGEPDDEIVFVGNVMIDSLHFALERAGALRARESLGVNGDYVLVTLHRPSNVDDPARLGRIVDALRETAAERPVILPAHPRTAGRLSETGMLTEPIRVIEPLDYLRMLDLMRSASVVVTDSGGVQEETTVLGIPCLTVRENTERPVTITEGTNQLVPDPARLAAAIRGARRPTSHRIPEGWDGHAGERIADALLGRIG